MKSLKYISVFFLLTTLWACQEVEPGFDFEPYPIQEFDADAGSWDPILLGTPTDLALPAPRPVNSDEYRAEVQDLIRQSQNLSSQQQEIIRYWGGNALVRWNEIARELVAKYNLPPAAGPDGQYPAPSQQNPGVYPLFPFSNPPYASRAYAYWSAAQFDALISCWHYKMQYNRPAPYVVETGISTSLPKGELPSYPSEDAVIAGVSLEILSFMFPLEAEFLKQKAAEHLQSRLWAGMNVSSDLSAGEALGKAAAAVFLQRARTDGMRNAVGAPAVWDSLANASKERFGWFWESQEVPKRPPMLPNFAKVKPWCIPSVEAVRAPAPPPIGSPEFQADVDELKQVAANLTAEQRRIANFWADGVGTYTPPGHWNRLAADYILQYRLNPIRTARVFAYLNMAMMDAGISCWDTKYYYHYPRPSQAIEGFRSLLGLPNFPAYTSGHSTFSGAAATVLSHFFPADAAELNRLAVEASLSRIYGGIHYRFDCELGVEAGNAIGEYSLKVARVDGGE